MFGIKNDEVNEQFREKERERESFVRQTTQLML